MSGSNELGGACKVVADSNGEDLKDHHLLDLSLGLLVLVDFLKLRYLVLILICKLPPVRAKLADGSQLRLTEMLNEHGELVFDLNKVLEVELEV